MPDTGLAKRYNRTLNGIERRMGSALGADYRSWRKELLSILERHGPGMAFRAAVRDGGGQLKRSAAAMARTNQPEISEAAHQYADRQLDILRKRGLAPAITPRVIPGSALEEALTASVDIVEASMLSSATQLQLAGEEADLVGRLLSVQIVDGRASTWRLGRNRLMNDVILGVWAAANGISGRIYDQAGGQVGVQYGRQAIAAIDERTTDCCLKVHGQIVGMEEKFHLTGTPRFADYVHAPPFHWGCRTAVALHHQAMEDAGVTTAEMRAAARDERDARKRTGRREEIHPAHSTSRRN